MANQEFAPKQSDREPTEGVLHERDEFLHVLTQHANDFIRLHRLDGRSVYASPSVERLYGQTPTTMFQFAHPEDVENCQRWWKEIVAGGTQRLHWRVRDVDGKWRWLETSAALVPYHNTPHVLTVCRDVTERIEAERDLRRNERLLAEAARIAHVGFWDNDLDADQITWSEETCRIAGIPQALGPRTLAAFQARIHPDDRPIQAAAYARAFSGEAPYDLEYRLMRPSGEVRFIHSLGEVMRDESGRAIRVFGVVQDVTERKRADEELRRTTTLLRAVADGTSDAVFVKALDGKYLLFNAAASGLVGKPISEVLGQDDTAIFDSDSARVVLAHDRRVMESGVASTEEEELTAGGVTRTYLAMKAPYRDEHGKVIGVIGISRDITDRKQAAVALQESEDRKTAILRGALDAIVTMDHEGNISGWNPAAERIFGYAEAEALGHNLANLIIPPALRPRHVEGLANLLASGQASILDQRLELSALRADGSEFPVELSVTRTRNFPRPLFTGFLRDITDRKQSEEARRAAEERLQHVVGSSPAVLFTLQAKDGEFRGINWLSSNIEAMLGYRVEETLGADWWLGNIDPEDRDAVVKQFLTEIVSNNYFSAEYRFRHKDGSQRWIRCEIRLLRDKAGKPAEAIGSLSDITERKQLEDQFRQSQKMEVVGHLAGGMAHDFNNLLAVILGFCQLLQNDQALGDDSRQLVEEIYKAANRAASLTKQLLAFSRRQILRPKLLNLNEVVTEAVAMLDRLIGEDITVKTNMHARLWPVNVDGGQMNQVIMNLAVNARDAMPQGGTLTIETSNVELDESYAQSHHEVVAGSYVMLVVSDTGSGMDEYTKSRIFEPFFTTKELGKGTGLGLATVFGIVNQSEGHVTVDSELGKGTTFKVYLPRHEMAADSGDEIETAESAPRGTETILVAEDEEMLRKLAFRILSSQGYQVLQAVDGEDALRVYRAHTGPIHLLLADVVMPTMDGRRLYDQLSAIQPELKVLFMSGYTDDAILRHGVFESTTNFIEKPFTYAALATSVRRILDAK